MDTFKHSFAKRSSQLSSEPDSSSDPHDQDTQARGKLFEKHERNVEKRIRLQVAVTLIIYSLMVGLSSWQYILPKSIRTGSSEDDDLTESPHSASDGVNQAVTSKVKRDFKLSTLEGKSNYETWVAEFEGVLRELGIAYIMEYQGPLDTGKKQLDNWLARNLILQHVSKSRAKRIRARMDGINQAWHVWNLLRQDVLFCPCNDLKHETRSRRQKVSRFQDGCASCQLILDVIKAHVPSRADLSKIVRSISMEVSSGIVRVSLDGVPTQSTHCEFFPQPAPPKCLSTNEQANSPISDSQQYVYLQIAASWLKNCIENHPGCTIANQNFMPTRLINVGNNALDPFLVEGKLEPAPYVALSYCWGTVANTLVTTRENIGNHRRRIPFSSLPQTLRDAVTVCRVMNVRYLWIDALCIIQNDADEQDWYTESGRMQHIYSNCLFAIAADISTNSDEGFLQEKYNMPRWDTVITRTNVSAKNQMVFYRSTTSFKHKNPDALLSSALSKRGWALQESILPNRILHFAAEEITWECNSHCQCQCGLSNYSLLKVSCCGILKARHPSNSFQYDDEVDKSRDIHSFLSSRTLKSVYWAWQTIVEYYTQRELTNHADKLSALSGLAQVAIDSHRFNEGDYLAGLWRGSLVKGLLWHVRGPSEPRRYTTYRAPSWSWASIDGGIKYFAEQYQFQFWEHITILEAACDTSPLDPTGRVKAGHIILSGKLVPIQLCVQKASPIVDVSMYTGYNGHASHTHKDQIAYVQRSKDTRMYEILLDERMEYGQWGNGYYCLKTGATFDERTNGQRVWWLILKEEAACLGSKAPPTFKRVGIGYKFTQNSTLDLFFQASMVTISLL